MFNYVIDEMKVDKLCIWNIKEFVIFYDLFGGIELN